MKKIQEYNDFFWDFVHKYDTQDENILRKIIHSYEVANHAFKIACYLGFDEQERLFAYVAGLFHDLGRFEQWKIYHTYNDKASTDHGEISYDILDKLDCKQLFDLTDEQIHVLKMGVKYHTKPYNGEDSKVALCTKIIKNADAMANVNTTANASHKIHVSVDGVTKEILDSFINMEPLWVYKYKTKLDRCLMLTANCYYVRYPFLRKEILECNFIDIMYESFSKYLNDEDKKIYKNAVEKMKVSYTSSCQKTIEQIENESKFVF